MIRPNEREAQKFTYTNTYGERLWLTVDLENGTALFGSDDFDETAIEDDRIQNTGLILADDEFAWVAGVWRQLFGRELEKLLFTRAMEEVARQIREQSGDDREHPDPH